MNEDIKQKIIEKYTSSSPTRDTSQDIVKSISNELSIKEASVRSVLVRSGIYLKPIKWRSWDIKDDEKDFILFKLGNFGNIENRYELLDELSEKFYIRQDGIKQFAKSKDVWPLTNDERREKEERKAKYEAEMEEDLKNDPEYQKILREQRESKRRYELSVQNSNRLAAKNRKMMRDDNIKTIFILIIVVIVLFSFIKSMFTEYDDRTDAEKALDNYCTQQGRSGCSDTSRKLNDIMGY